MLAPTVNTLVSGNLPSLFFFTFFTTQDGGRCPPSSIPLSLPDPSTSFLSTWTRLLLLWTVTLGLFQMVCNIGEGLTAFPLYSPCSCTPCGFPVISQVRAMLAPLHFTRYPSFVSSGLLLPPRRSLGLSFLPLVLSTLVQRY
jgi:hypothetical protein